LARSIPPTKSIYFAILSFTDDSLRDAIIARAQAGVTVRGIFDNTNAGSPYAEYEDLCNAGIPNKREDFRGFMHNKLMIVDINGTAPVVVAGSMNWSDSGANDNDENTLIFHDPGVAQAYHDEWQQLWSAIALENMCNPFRTYVPVVLKMR
jgi:phosphatidylserine/phosphatidylglycerophosphate/cardiolipin synthase-like enzyme